MAPVAATSGWTVILPIKDLAMAKSRLGLASADDLMFAFAVDTLSAVTSTAGVAEVIVATSDPRIIDLARSLAIAVVDDREQAGINAAAAVAAGRRRGDGGVAVMVADLPALTSDALARVLHLGAAHPTAVLPDADGDGTTIWLTAATSEVRPRFGPASRAAHVAAGAVDLVEAHPKDRAVVWPARCDVDTAADLDRAVALGVGEATRAHLSGHPA